MKNCRLINMILVCVLMLALSGCWGSRELDDLSITIGIGFDKAEKPDNVKLTAQIVKPGEIKSSNTEGTGGSSSKPYWNIQRSAPTVFAAIRDYTNFTGKKLYIAHNQVFIFGQDLASEGVLKYLEFFMRAHETRPTSIILVSTSTAEEVLDMEPEAAKFPAVNTVQLTKAADFTSFFSAVNLQEFTSRLMSKTTSPIAPLVSIANHGDKQSAYISGMAVFKRDKMVGILTTKESRGVLWTNNKIKSGVIEVDCPGGDGIVSLEITSAKSSLVPKIKDGNVIIHVQIKEEAVIVSQTCTEDLVKVSRLKLLQKRQEDLIRKEIMMALRKAKNLEADVFGFGDKVHMVIPREWKQMEASWEEIFQNLEIQTDIECTIRSTGLITKPAVPESVD